MIVAPVSPEAPCVDAARDSLYCPQDTQFIPQAAPRGAQPPTPKPRSGNLGYPKGRCSYANKEKVFFIS